MFNPVVAHLFGYKVNSNVILISCCVNQIMVYWHKK